MPPDDPNTTQNPISEENPIPVSSHPFDSAQDLTERPTEPAPISPIDSEPAEVPSDAPEAPREGFSDESNNITLPNSTPVEAEGENGLGFANPCPRR